MGRFFLPMEFLGNCSLRTYNKLSKGIRKIVEHKAFRPVFSVVFVVAFFLLAAFPNASEVLGQMQASPAALIKTDTIATEEIITTTKSTSRFPVVGHISQGFSYYHPGIDIEQPFGSPIFPFLAGVIFETGYNTGGYGNYVLIDHLNGYFSLYAHLNAILMRKGDSVLPETAIGTIGLTGYSTGPHLHLEVYENGQTINPLSVLPQDAIASMSASLAKAPASLPSRTLVTPISQTPSQQVGAALQTPPATGGMPPKAPEKTEEEKLGVWLPTELKQSTSTQAVKVGSTYSLINQIK